MAAARRTLARVMLTALTFLLLSTPLACVMHPVPGPDPLNDNKPRRPIRVVEVVALDQLRLEDGRTVELHGVKPPPANDPAAIEGREYLRRLVQGREVIVDGDRENYYAHAWHAYVFLPQGQDFPLFVNGDLVRKGYGYAFITPPNDYWQSWLREQQFEAREERRGVWARQPEPDEYYLTDRTTNLFHRHDCAFAKKLQQPERIGSRADAVSDHKIPCPDCGP